MSDNRDAVQAFRNNLSFTKCLISVAQSLLGGFLVIGFGLAGGFGMNGCATDSVKHRISGPILLEFLQCLIVCFCRNSILLDLADHFSAGYLVIEHVINITHAEGALLLRGTLWRLSVADQIWELLVGHFDCADSIFSR